MAGERDDCENKERRDKFSRFLFSNGVNLVTLLVVAFSAGIVVQRVDAMERTLAPLTLKVQLLEIQLAITKANVDRFSK